MLCHVMLCYAIFSLLEHPCAPGAVNMYYFVWNFYALYRNMYSFIQSHSNDNNNTNITNKKTSPRSEDRL